MRRLNPLSADDRRITAYTNYWIIEPLFGPWVQVGHLSYDCWGKEQHEIKKITMDAKSAAEHVGFRSYVTLELMQRGCCPVIAMELAEIAEASAD